MTNEARDTPWTTAAKLDAEARECLLDLSQLPNAEWSMGEPTWKDHAARLQFYELGLVAADDPEATPDGPVQQLWRFNERGMAVADYLRRAGAAAPEMAELLETAVALFEQDEECSDPGTDAYTWRVNSSALLARLRGDSP